MENFPCKDNRPLWLKKASAFALLCAALLLCPGCGPAQTEPEAEAAGNAATALDLHGESIPALSELAGMQALESLDLRGHALSTDEYDALAAALPTCEILWSVPLSGGRCDSDTEALTLSALSAEEAPRLCYFPRLASLSLAACAPETAAAIAKLCADGRLHCTLYWRAEVCGVAASSTDTYIDLSGTEPLSMRALTDGLSLLPLLEGASLVNRPFTNEEKASLALAFPDICFYWTVERDGITCLSTDEKLDLNVFSFTDIEDAASFLHCFMGPATVDMATLGFVNAEMAWLSKEFPENRFVWTVQLGRLALRTDATVFTGRSGSNGRKFTDADVDALRYCTDLVALDLSKNKLTGLAWIASLNNLRVLILSENQIADLSPLSALNGLVTLDLSNNAVTDLSALSAQYSLLDLNLSGNAILDAGPILANDSLEYVFLSGNPLLEGQEAALAAAFPECSFDFAVANLSRAWRRTDRAQAIERMWDTGYPEALFLSEE